MSQEEIVSKPGSEVDRVERAAGGSFFVTPAADIWHNRDGYTLEVEMPGVNRNSVEVSVEDGKLMVTGHRQLGQCHSGGQSPHREEEGERRGYRRVFDLSPEVNASGIRANLEEGLLTLHVPKSESVRPRKIIVE
ncbi:MAG: Hsp20/alpha crystallin family protein [Candidatus Xiphinematobacter sp.]|nr:MAG: Hsp20/alpha crystallin family protein [Candidatus Xiphinematobacter sp.]QQY10761.1 MAG: Hsp20/alpha crystallin family protein [Candidatus Xiphinematobacter sp.]